LPGHLGEFHPWLSTVTNCGQPMHHVHFKGWICRITHQHSLKGSTDSPPCMWNGV
jgi:hypothetical protein